MKINSVSISDPCFQGRLEPIPNPPETLFSVGNVAITVPAVAIVGTRKPTAYGKAITLELAEKLAKKGVLIVSGLALGVDGLAHQGALNVGGRTIGVLANGLDTIYPASHRQLALDIIKKDGGLLSEYAPGTPSMAHQFLERNRLVSALADAVIVTEAAAKSGTMNTVMHALSQGKDVYAVPGNITSPMSAGCNKLIEQGAVPIADIDAFVASFVPLGENVTRPLLLAETPEEQSILDLLQSGIADGDELQHKSNLDPVAFSTALTMLELRGIIRPVGANHWSL